MPQISETELNRLKGAVAELSTLNKIANAINVSMSVDQITSIIVDQCCRRVKASQGAIFLLDDEEQEEDRFRTFVRQVSDHTEKVPFHLNLSLQGWMVKNRTILLSNDPQTDERLRGVDFKAIGLDSLVAAPLMSQRGLIGVIVLFNKTGNDGFADADARFLGIVGTQVSKVIENARLFERDQQLAVIQEELKVAQSIQHQFLPHHTIENELFEVVGFNESAREVGGDYYDIVELSGNRVFLSLGDVSGKGLPAALLMSNAQAVLRSHLLSGNDDNLQHLAACLNQVMVQFTAPGQYITTVFGIYYGETREFRYINAGHLPPLVVRSGTQLEKPSDSDLVIGVLPDVAYQPRTITLHPADQIVLYTDGVTEATNTEAIMFGDERLDQSVIATTNLTARQLCDRILSDLHDYRGDAEQSDDITVVVLRTGYREPD